MEQEYTISTFYKIFYGILAVGLFCFGLFLFSIKGAADVSPAFYMLPLLLIVGAVLIVINIIRRKIVVYDDRIIYISLFRNMELALSDVKGCRIGEKVIYLESSLEEVSKMSISNYSDFGNSEDLVTWVESNFKDLDKIDLANEREALTHDSSLGSTENDREKKLKKMRGVAIAYNIWGLMLGFGCVFIKNTFSTIALVIYPLLGVLLIILSRGLIKFVSNSKRSVYGFTFLGIALPSFTLLFKSLFTYDMLSYNNLWLPSLLFAALLFFLLSLKGINRAIGSVKGQLFLMLVTALGYGFGCTRQINCEFDNSEIKIVNSTIQSKWEEYNKGKHYHLKINSWDGDPKPKDIEVSKNTYSQHHDGDAILVYVKKGLFNIPWYYIKE